MIDGEKTFLIPVKAGQPEWNLIEIEGVDKLPAVQWKLTSVQRMSVKTTEGAFGKAKASTRIVKSISPINLALERKFLLLIDDWRAYEAAQAAGVEVVNSLAYLVGLYEQKRITLERALHALARMTRRGTLRPEWIQSALRVVAEIRRHGEN